MRALVIPPAWKDVWICPHPDGHLQAMGTDSAGRRQYLYHEAWSLKRSRQKHRRAVQLGARLPSLRATLQNALDEPGLGSDRVLAAALRLVDLGVFRVGSEQYQRTSGTFGLATLQRTHVRLVRGAVEVRFNGKGGVESTQRIEDPQMHDVLGALLHRRDSAPELFSWWSKHDRTWHVVRSRHITDHLHALAGPDVLIKDFRTWHATVLMAMALSDAEPGSSRALKGAYEAVAEVLNNTPTVTRSAYVDPRVVDLWRSGTRLPRPEPGPELVPLRASRAVCRLLR